MGIFNKYAVLVKHESYSSETQNTFLRSDDFNTAIIGVSNADEAISVISELVNKGIQLVELCGGFTMDEKNQIKKEVKDTMPLGLVKLDDEDVQLLESNLKE